MPKVIISFDRDESRIGTTVEMDEATARVAIAEGRARLASDKGNPNLRRPAGPTRTPPQPEVVGTERDVAAGHSAAGTAGS